VLFGVCCLVCFELSVPVQVIALKYSSPKLPTIVCQAGHKTLLTNFNLTLIFFHVSLFKLTFYGLLMWWCDGFDQYLDLWCFQEHFFTESRGQTGYIQDRLKRIRRSLAPEAQQRPRSSVQNKEASTRRADDGKKLLT